MNVREEIRECGRVMRLVWPLALGMANNAVMQFIDRAFLARESAWSLEAVLPASVLSFLFTGFFMSLASYSGVFVAQYHGAGDAGGCRKSYFAGLAVSAVGALCLLALVPAGGPAFRVFGHAGEVLAREVAYYSIVTAGGGALCAVMAASGYFTGCGRTRIVFWVNLLGNALNVALDGALIFGLGPFPALGIRGAAIATVAAQAFQAVVLNAMALRRVAAAAGAAPAPAVPVRFPAVFARVVRFGLPASVYQLFNFLSFTVFVFLTGRVGGMAFAASNACFTVNYLLIAPTEGFSVGAATLVGQRQGAGDPRGAARAGNRTLCLALAYVAAASALVLVFHRPILALFAADDAPFAVGDFTALGFTLFLLMTAWQLFDAADVTLSGALKGAGDTHFVMVWMLVASFVFWMPLLFFVYSRRPTMPALWSTMVAYVVVICVGTALRWGLGPWRRIRLIARGGAETETTP